MRSFYRVGIVRGVVVEGLVVATCCWGAACSDDDASDDPARAGRGGAAANHGGTGGRAGSTGGGGSGPGGDSGGDSASEGGASNTSAAGAGAALPNSGGSPGAAGFAGLGGDAGGPGDAPPVVILYLDSSRDRVMWLPARTRVPRILVSNAGDAPDGIAVDPARGALFWTTSGAAALADGSVMRANLDGSDVSELVPNGATFSPKQLALDLAASKLYWADREGMRVQRADLDGQSLETLVSVGSSPDAREDPKNHVVGIALDPDAGWLYWTQVGGVGNQAGSIRRARLEIPEGETAEARTDVQVLLENLAEPIDLAIDPVAGFLYWSSRGDSSVNRAGLEIPSGASAAERRDVEVLVSDLEAPLGLALDPDHQNLYYTTLAGTIGRYDLLTGSWHEVLTGGGALTGLAVVAPF